MDKKTFKTLSKELNPAIAKTIFRLESETEKFIQKKYGITKKDYKLIEKAINERLIKNFIPEFIEAIREEVTKLALKKNGIDPEVEKPRTIENIGLPAIVTTGTIHPVSGPEETDQEKYDRSVTELFKALRRIPAKNFRDRVPFGESYDIWVNGKRIGLNPGMMLIVGLGSDTYKIFDPRVNQLMDYIRSEKNDPSRAFVTQNNRELIAAIEAAFKEQELK